MSLASKYYYLFTFGFLILARISYGQNLVLNHSFEDLTKCPDIYSFIYGAINDAEYWNIPTIGTPDLFSPCNSNPLSLSVPENTFGYQHALDGQNYAGFYVFNSGGSNIREYIQGELAVPLKKDKMYRASCYISLSDDNAEITIRTLGFHFSTTRIMSNDRFLDVQPQIVDDPGLTNLYTDWIRVEGTFIAQGGEEFITIGNFSTDSESDTIAVGVIDNPSLGSNRKSYFYIDNVSVEPVEEDIFKPELNFVNTVTRTSFRINYTEINPPSLNLELYNATGQLLRIVTFNESIDVSMSNFESGIYYCRLIKNNEIVAVQKIVKVY